MSNPRYPGTADYTTNSPSYYDELARKQGLFEELVKRIWEYDKVLAEKLKEVNAAMRTFTPEFGGEWDKEKAYDWLTIVTHEGSSYTSLKDISAGVDILNEEYWIPSGNFDAQIEGYRRDVRTNAADIVSITDKLKTEITAYDFGLYPGTSTIDNQRLRDYFTLCQTTGQKAVFEKGVYVINGDGFQLPDMGIKGKGRSETIFNVTGINSNNPVFKFGANEGWTRIKGNIEDIGFSVPDGSLTNVLDIDTPTRAVQVKNVRILIGAGFAVTLNKCYYVHFEDVVIEGAFRDGLPTNINNAMNGTAFRNFATEVNNLSFTKCEFKYLSRIWSSATTLFQGSNTILFTGCAFESIGNTLFIANGFRFHFDSCYFEFLDMNRNVPTHPNYSNLILLNGGGGETIFTNVLLNLGGVRSTANLIRYALGAVVFNQGSVTNRPRDMIILEPITYSSRGVIIDNQCVGLYANQGGIKKMHQQNINIYPSFVGQESYANPVHQSEYAKNSLFHQSTPTPVTYTFSVMQPIVSVEGRGIASSHIVEVDVTLYRIIPVSNDFGWKKLKIRFMITPSMPDKITPLVEVLSSGGNQAGFSDVDMLTKIEAFRRTPARTDLNADYLWHYQLGIRGETGGSAARILANKVETNILWVNKGTADTTHPSYGIYPQSHIFANP